MEQTLASTETMGTLRRRYSEGVVGKVVKRYRDNGHYVVIALVGGMCQAISLDLDEPIQVWGLTDIDLVWEVDRDEIKARCQERWACIAAKFPAIG